MNSLIDYFIVLNYYYFIIKIDYGMFYWLIV